MAVSNAEIARIADDPEKSDAERIAAIKEAIGSPGQATTDRLWTILVVGLVGISTLALVALMLAVLDKSDETSPDVFLTVFTAALTGLLGLFVNPQT